MSRPEIVIGLIGAIGTDLDRVEDAIARELSAVDYAFVGIRLSQEIREFVQSSGRQNTLGLDDLDHVQGRAYIDRHMDAGNILRSYFGSGNVVARLGVMAIQRERARRSGDAETPNYNTAYVLRSLKTPDEVQSLRRLYGDQFLALSVYSPREKRIGNLAAKFAKESLRYDIGAFSEEAERLVQRDEKELDAKFGQNVQKAFPEADVFVAEGDELDAEIRRTIAILFSHPFTTPTRDEFAMFHAFASAMRSADLARQVGAVVTSSEGDILASGCNDVPKPGGGTFWEEEFSSETDDRDFRHGRDASAMMKIEIVTEIFQKLRRGRYLRDSLLETYTDTTTVDIATLEKIWSTEAAHDFDRFLARRALFEEDAAPLEEAQVADILEYGRTVHAEMAAITDAAKRGIAIREAELFCTTFPCHMCARHIIAAGLSRVVYIQPYPKSKAKELYMRSIQVESDRDANANAVRFEPFVGVAPRRYIQFFERGKRKDAYGYAEQWSAKEAVPNVSPHTPDTYLAAEEGMTALLKESDVLKSSA